MIALSAHGQNDLNSQNLGSPPHPRETKTNE
jgi:hypothetical protein